MPSSTRQKLQVFVSSTYKDLIEDRQAAVGAILKAGHIPAGMELFNAGDRKQLDIIKQWIDESDIFMLILGGRYGSIEPLSGLSYTEVEYDYAVTAAKPFFAVVIKDEALKGRVRTEGEDVLELENRDKLKTFRAKVEGIICSYFSSDTDIKLAVHESIPELAHRHSLTGWVRADTIPDTTGLVNEVSRLGKENERLLNELRHAQDVALRPRDFVANDEQELFDLAARLAMQELKRMPQDENGIAEFIRITGRARDVYPSLPKCNMLGAFFFHSEAMSLGMRYFIASAIDTEHWSTEDFTIEPCLSTWSLEDIIEIEKNGHTVILRLTQRGKKLYRKIASLAGVVKAPNLSLPKTIGEP